MKYTREHIPEIIKILGTCATVSEACAQLGAKYGRSPDPSSMRQMFVAAGKKAPREYLRTPASVRAADVSPLERRETKSAADRLRTEHATLVEQLREAKARQAVLDACAAPAAPLVLTPFTLGAKRSATAVACASDWHVEENVALAQTQGRNEFNLAIAHKRAERFFAGIVWLVEHHRAAFDVRDLVLWFGGDLLSGYIHEELQESNELSPIQTVIWLRSVLTAGLHLLLNKGEFKRLTVVCSHGNHGRTTPKRRISTGAFNSFEWLLYQILREDFKHDPRVVFVTDATAHQYVVVRGAGKAGRDWTLHFHHGDEVGYGGGVGGITIPLNKRVPQWDRVRKSDYHYIGHFHQLIDIGHTGVNGSLIGYNAYAMSIGAAYEEPRQLFHLLDHKRGKTCVSPIWVKE